MKSESTFTHGVCRGNWRMKGILEGDLGKETGYEK